MKSKNKTRRRTIIRALIFAAIAALLLWFVRFADIYYNGSAANYFANLLIYEYNGYYGIRTDGVRALITALIIALLVVIALLFLVGRLGERRRARQDNADLLEYLSGNSDALPSELAETGARVTEMKMQALRAEQLLREETARKNDLVMYLAHDLKTPLASVVGYISLLRDEENISPELRRKYLGVALDKAERLEELINEFFEITRYNLSNVTLEKSRVSLTLLLEQLSYEFLPMLKEKNQTVALSAQPELYLRCDADKLSRVFDNLLRNAVMYGAEGTEISVSAEIEGQNAVVTVQNCGETIPEEKLSRLFEQFYRLDYARSTHGGAGLGLAIAKQIVELHGGEIKAESHDGLVIFTVTIPLSLENL